MSTLLDIRPPEEPLPAYSRDDPDALSVHSAAPSYVSDTPPYTSHRAPTSLLPPLPPGQQTQTIGLPAPRVYAPGFAPELRNRGLNPPSKSRLNMGSWSSPRTSNNARQYSAVARRRASQAQADKDADAVLTSLATMSPASPAPASTSTAYPVQVAPLMPLEDARLVGAEAAERARRARVYREMCLREEATMRHESRSWEFMAGQMREWRRAGRATRRR